MLAKRRPKVSDFTPTSPLRRFYHRWQLDQRKQDFDAAILQLGSSGQAKFEEAAIAAVVHRLFQIAVTADATGRNIDRAARWVLAIQKQRLHERQLQLAEKKAGFAAVVMEVKEPYQKIITAREMLYGALDDMEEEE